MAKSPQNFRLNDLYGRFNALSREAFIVELHTISNPWGARVRLMESSVLQLSGWLRDGCGQITSLWTSPDDSVTVLIDEFQHGARANVAISTRSFDQLASCLLSLDVEDLNQEEFIKPFGCVGEDDHPN